MNAQRLFLLSAADEGLSGGELAGIVIGVFTFAACIGCSICSRFSYDREQKKKAEQRERREQRRRVAAVRAADARAADARAAAARSAAQQVCDFMPAESQVAPQAQHTSIRTLFLKRLAAICMIGGYIPNNLWCLYSWIVKETHVVVVYMYMHLHGASTKMHVQIWWSKLHESRLSVDKWQHDP